MKPPLQPVVKRTLVCLPGMDGSALMFRPLVEAAPPDVDVVTIGYPPGPANSYQQLLPQVQAALPDARPYYLLGWSFSGPMALLVAATRPPLLRGVVLASSFATAPVRYLPRWIRHLARPWLFRMYPATSQLKALMGGYATSELRALLADAHRKAGAEALACRAREAMAVDVTDALAGCTVPVLYLRASADEVVSRRCADHVRRTLPSADIVDLRGPHLALVTDPAASWAALGRFMDRVEGSAGR